MNNNQFTKGTVFTSSGESWKIIDEYQNRWFLVEGKTTSGQLRYDVCNLKTASDGSWVLKPGGSDTDDRYSLEKMRKHFDAGINKLQGLEAAKRSTQASYNSIQQAEIRWLEKLERMRDDKYHLTGELQSMQREVKNIETLYTDKRVKAICEQLNIIEMLLKSK